MAILHKKHVMTNTRQEIYTITLSKSELLALINMMKLSDVSPETGEYSVSEKEYKIIVDLQTLINESVSDKKTSKNYRKAKCPICHKTQSMVVRYNNCDLIACHNCKNVNYCSDWTINE